jgi:putative DNA primase/helicase
VDVLHSNRYPIIAPSVHVSGGVYEWEPGRDPISAAFLLLPAPEWVFGEAGCDSTIAGDVEDDQSAIDVRLQRFEETPENIARLQSALEYVPADCSREEWRDRLFAINSTGWECAEDIAIEWSLSEPGLWDESAFDNIWDSAKAERPGGLTVATIFYSALQNGWRDPQKRRPDTLGDLSNGRRFAERHREKFLYVGADRGWRRFDGYRWVSCAVGEEMQAAKDVADDLLAEKAKALAHEPSRANEQNHKLALTMHRSAARLREMVAMASSEPGMSVANPTAFDGDPWKLGVRNGVVDLLSGKLLSADPSQRISKQAGATFRLDALCPQWLKFLRRTFGSTEMVEFIQRALGYTLTGVVDEEKLFFCHGLGANGKSVFANVVCAVFGDYAVTVGSELLARNKHENEAARYKTRLPGARLALANEVGEGDTWDDHRVKELVSRERIAGRALYSEAYDFMPSHKLWVRGNHKPGILDAGDGMWRRMVLIGFECQIPEEHRVPDLDRQLLDAERDGVLAWMVRGCLKWQKNGLQIPASIANATAVYRKDSDVLGSWLDERCGHLSGSRLSVTAAYEDFFRYYKDAGMLAPARPAFVRRIGQRGHQRVRSNGRDFFADLELRDPPSASEGGSEDPFGDA